MLYFLFVVRDSNARSSRRKTEIKSKIYRSADTFYVCAAVLFVFASLFVLLLVF